MRIPQSLKEVKLFENQEEAIVFYKIFLEYLYNKKYDASIQLERHHVIPLHANGSDTEDNIIRISPEDHVAIHFYRYQAYGEKGDKLAYTMRLADSNERAKLRAQAAIEANKTKKQLFWNSDWQRIQGLKGGSKGGSKNTINQWNARQKVGLAYGRIVGISNQSTPLKEFLKHYVLWKHKSDSVLYETEPAESLSDVIRQLEKHKPGFIRNYSSFHKMVLGERARMYGWEIVNKVIRSEAKEKK